MTSGTENLFRELNVSRNVYLETADYFTCVFKLWPVKLVFPNSKVCLSDAKLN